MANREYQVIFQVWCESESRWVDFCRERIWGRHLDAATLTAEGMCAEARRRHCRSFRARVEDWNADAVRWPVERRERRTAEFMLGRVD